MMESRGVYTAFAESTLTPVIEHYRYARRPLIERMADAALFHNEAMPVV